MHFQRVKFCDTEYLFSGQPLLTRIAIFLFLKLLLDSHSTNIHDLVFLGEVHNFKGFCLVNDVDFE